VTDAFGKALMAHFRGEEAEYLIERDDGYIDTFSHGAVEYFVGYENWPLHEREAALEARGRILDVGCGAGREALWLQGRGNEVVAIDISPIALDVSRARGVKDCQLMDVRDLYFPDDYFDTVVMFGNNFGIAGDIMETRRMLDSLHRFTGEDGIVIASTRDPLKTDNPVHLVYHEKNRRRERPPGLVKIRICFRGECDDWFELLMVGEDELSEVLDPTGWTLEKVYRSEGANYTAILKKR
jgi:SAM-dependent methyltransferase